MKIILLFILSFALVSALHSQSLPDSVITKYHAAKKTEEKINTLGDYLFSVAKKDSMLNKDSILSVKSTGMLSYFKKQNDEIGTDISELFISSECLSHNDYAGTLQLALPVLSRFKERNDTAGMLMSYGFIANTYDNAKNFKEAIVYILPKIPLFTATGEKKGLAMAYNDIGAMYGEAFMPDSGLVYAQKALTIAAELKEDHGLLGNALSTLAENYIDNKDYDFAMPFLQRALKHLFADSIPNKSNISWIYNDFAQAFLGTKHYDSTNYYAHLSILYSIPAKDQKQQLRAYEYLTQSFEAIHQPDSANKYFRLAATIKDSVYSVEKTKAIAAIGFHELMNQQELQAEKARAEDERKQNIQYAFIGLGLIVSLTLYLLLSRSVITNTKMIQFLGVMALLIVFEFLNLVLHPYIDKMTHHTPLFMLLAMVLISALLIPLHHRIEKWATARLVEKNKEIRLAQAKKTIEMLEGK